MLAQARHQDEGQARVEVAEPRQPRQPRQPNRYAHSSARNEPGENGESENDALERRAEVERPEEEQLRQQCQVIYLYVLHTAQKDQILMPHKGLGVCRLL